jgi:hypothetical protein
VFRFTAVALQAGVFHQTKVKKSHRMPTLTRLNPKTFRDGGIPILLPVPEVVAALGH